MPSPWQRELVHEWRPPGMAANGPMEMARMAGWQDGCLLLGVINGQIFGREEKPEKGPFMEPSSFCAKGRGGRNRRRGRGGCCQPRRELPCSCAKFFKCTCVNTRF